MSVSGRRGVIVKITRDSEYSFVTVKEGSKEVKLHTYSSIVARLREGDTVLYSVKDKKAWRYKGVNFGYIRKAN